LKCLLITIKCKRTALYTKVNGGIHASKTAKIIKGDISHQHITEMCACCCVISPFTIAVFDAGMLPRRAYKLQFFYIYICCFITV